MSETPRLRSAFPASPKTDIRSRNFRNSPSGIPSSPSTQARPSPVTKPVQNTVPTRPQNNGPLVSLDVIDAPTQRFYVASFYIGLLGWRFYNAWNVTDDLDSTWLFLKWIGLDAAFFVALPAFKIPWLEWSFITTLTIWMLHAIANAFLMYRIPIPILGWLGAMVKVAYDRELAISEHRVKPADILHNSSIILGKQIIQILPEGSAILNPEKLAFCLDSTRTTVELPIHINQTTPISIELTRYDIGTDETETIFINAKQTKKMKKEADRTHAKSDTASPRVLQYDVAKTGLYQLTRVIDETKLEVRKRSYDVAVVACPRASVSVDAIDKCTGDLSGISLHVEGVPPFKVRYIKRINQEGSSSIEQNIQPSDSDPDASTGVILDPKNPHRAWTQSRKVSVEINESLHQNGTWSYHVEEVEDGLGNKVMFDTDKFRKVAAEDHSRSMTVHKRPIAFLSRCNSQNPLAIAEGSSTRLPVQIKSQDQIPAPDWPLTLKYSFTSGTEDADQQVHIMSNGREVPQISAAGRYSLDSIQSQYCQGEIKEPSSCTLYNPPRPNIAMDHESVYDKCAGNPIGMFVNLDFTGTPPFSVRYAVTYQDRAHHQVKKFDSMRGQLEFLEHSAGSYTYQILEVQDSVYDEPVSLKERGLILKQDIKPPAYAAFSSSTQTMKACLGQPVSLPVRLQGEAPWTLDYELVRGGKRKKFSVHSELDVLDIDLPELSEGGKYSLVLTSIQDKSKCKNALTGERHIEVRAERPSAAFGDVGGSRSIKSLEGKKIAIPLRLQGVSPWLVKIQNIDRSTAPKEYHLRDMNAIIEVQDAGTYELTTVHDNCPGVVDPKANKFTVSWIERPNLGIRDATTELTNTNIYSKVAVCQGHEDSLSLALTGSPPYHLHYTQISEPLQEKNSVVEKQFSVASNNAMIKMITSKAGEYTYTFKELADDRYNNNKHHFSKISVKQQVYPLPTAKFTNSGKTYSYCKDDPSLASEADAEIIPITLTGSPPFSVELAITHHGASARPEIKRISEIPSNTFSWSLARSTFDLGSHSLQIRSVKDSRGCESIAESNPSSVRIHVSSPPTINALESSVDYCVGDRVSFSLSGQSPFDVFYTFQGRERKARVTNHEFRRIAESPGEFTITGVSDSAMGGGGKCRAKKDIQKIIHPYPSVRIERGETKIDDIHEGGEVDIHFEFTGTPPFEFTYTRSENLLSAKNRKLKNRKPQILETRHDISMEFSKTIRASEEGTYEVVAIKDRYCAYSAVTGAGKGNGGGIGSSKLLKNE